MKRVFIAVVCCGVLLAGAAPRAADPVPVQPSIAGELARLMMPEENWKQSMQGVAAQMKQFVASMGKDGKPMDDCAHLLFDDVMGMFTYQELLDIETSALAKHYTDAELRELLAFYRTPIGQKTIRIQPQLGTDVTGQSMAIMQQRMPAIMEKVKTRVEKCSARHGAGSSTKQ